MWMQFQKFNFRSCFTGWYLCMLYENAIKWMPRGFTDDKSTLVQVMAWSCQATIHSLSQCGPSSMSAYDITRQQCWVTFWLVHFPRNFVLCISPIENHTDRKVHGANMGPIWGREDPGGPHVGPMNFAICAGIIYLSHHCFRKCITFCKPLSAPMLMFNRIECLEMFRLQVQWICMCNLNICIQRNGVQNA